MIRLRGVSVAFGRTRVVDQVSATVADGEWVALIGPNGAGKTTLLRAIAGLVPFTGAIEVGGDPIGSLQRRELARRVALVPQIPLMPGELSVADYVLLGRTPYLSYLGSERRADLDAAERALRRLDLDELAGRRLGSLSGGEWQRAVLGRALAQDAQVLLLDEPTNALDAGRQQRVLELVDELRGEQRLTVVSAMHDLTLAGQYAERVLLMNRGGIAAEGAAADVLTEALIAEHYGARVRVLEDGAVVPVRPRPARPAAGA